MAREERGDRGLGWYFDRKDTYDDVRVELSDSSSAEAPHCWLSLDQPRRFHMGRETGGTCSAHLDVKLAHDLRDALDEWLAYHQQPFGPVCQRCGGSGWSSERKVAGCLPCGGSGRV